MGRVSWFGNIAGRFRLGRERQVAGHTQSFDELFSILRRSYENAFEGGAVQGVLSDSEARQRCYRWQFAAAGALARAVMMTPLHVQQRRGEKWEDQPAHPLALLLQDVNYLMTGPEWLWWATFECAFTGKSFWSIADNGMAEPGELWPILGDMEPQLDAAGKVTAWQQRVTVKGVQKTHVWPQEEILYLRLPKVGDLFGGIGPIQAAGSAIRLDDQIVASEFASFKSAVFPSGIAKFDEPDVEKRAALLNEMNERYASTRNTGKLMGISPGIELQFPQTKPREMGFPQGAKDQRDIILALSGTPAAIVGISEDVNRASAEGLEYIFAKWTVAPLLTLLVARLNQDLARKRYGPDIRIRFDSPVPSDRAQDVAERDTDLRNGVITVNEARETKGLQPVPWGNVPLLPLGVAPLGTAPPAPPQAQAQAVGPEIPQASAVVAQSAKAQRHAALHARYEAESAKLRKRLESRFAAHFGRVQEEFLTALDKHRGALSLAGVRKLALPPEIEAALDPERMAADLVTNLAATNRWGIVLGGTFERDASIPAPEDSPWNEQMPQARRTAQQYGSRYYSGIAQTTREHMTDVVSRALDSGLDFAGIKAAVEDAFGAMRDSRAANIAFTETTRLYGAGGQAFRDEYQIGRKQWVCSFIRSRDTHIRAHGQVVDNGQPFRVGADLMMFPGGGRDAAENCNCNCLSVGYIGD